MSVLERAKKSWSEKLTEINEIEVPEWGDEAGPLIIYVRPSNLAERDKLFKSAKEETLESLVQVLIIRAREKDGTMMFRPADKSHLMTAVDPDVISEVARKINSDLISLEAELEDAEKN